MVNFIIQKLKYRTHTLKTCGLYIFYPFGSTFLCFCGVGCSTRCITTLGIPPRSYKSYCSARFLLTWLRHLKRTTRYSVIHDTSLSHVYLVHCLTSCCLWKIYHMIFTILHRSTDPHGKSFWSSSQPHSEFQGLLHFQGGLFEIFCST